MSRITIIALAVAWGIAGCAPETPEPVAEAPQPELTADRGRDALIELIRSPDPGELNDFPLGQFLGDGVEGGVIAPSWGPFTMLLKEREYIYYRVFGQPPRACRWQYRGRFELRDGRWVALPPRLEWQALGPE